VDAPAAETLAPNPSAAGADLLACASPQRIAVSASGDVSVSLSGALAQERPDALSLEDAIERARDIRKNAMTSRVMALIRSVSNSALSAGA
jgi:hypothetical protein